MRKIRVIEHLSLDGIIQGPGGPNEDRDNGFGHGGWAAPFDAPEAGALAVDAHTKGKDLILGRKTYDIWAAYWPLHSNPIADGINSATKYVATHHAGTLEWGPAEALGEDVEAGLRQLKSSEGPDLICWGSSTVVPLLIANGLADEIILITYPVVIGSGKRLFSSEAPTELHLLKSTPTTSGVVINHFSHAGALRTGN